MAESLRRFQRRFVDRVLGPTVTRAALSIPRGNGKSWLCGFLVSEAVRPGGRLFFPGVENVLLSGSFDQARYVWRFARDMLGEDGFVYTDNKQSMTIQHKPTRTRLVVKSSRARGAFGIVGARLAIADEPGAWDTIGGQMMADALDTSLGKPGSPLTVVYVGTLAPARAGWWCDLVTAGSRGTTYVQALQGDLKRWDQWPEIRRCNPLTAISSAFRAKLLEERDDARADSRLKARFLSYRLNRPTADEATVLLTVDEWERVCTRAVPPRAGRPIVGIDMGGGRAWSAAVAVWRNGRIEARAVAPGVPSIAEQERRDRAPRGSYDALVRGGTLRIAEGLRVPTAAHLLALVRAWLPEVIIGDRARANEVRDAGPSARFVTRVTQWFEASEDYRALRKQALDGDAAVSPESRPLLAASLAAAKIEHDASGNSRHVKRDPSNNTSRDDVVAAWLLAAGALSRAPKRRPVKLHIVPAA